MISRRFGRRACIAGGNVPPCARPCVLRYITNERERGGERIVWLDEELTRRQLMRGGLASGLAVSAGGLLAACGSSKDNGGQPSGQQSNAPLRKGGTLKV